MGSADQKKIRTILVWLSAAVMLISGSVLASEDYLLGTATDGSQVRFRMPKSGDPKAKAQKAVAMVSSQLSGMPATPQEYVKRMRRACMGRKGLGWGLGLLAMMPKAVAEEFPQEFSGDFIGLGLANVFQMSSDDPAWAIHWAEQSLSGDTALQILMAVAIQNTVTSAMIDVIDDTCNYYLASAGSKKFSNSTRPLPLDNLTAAELNAMSPDEKLIARRLHERIRTRRASLNGGAMGLGMFISQQVIAYKNDPNVRKCNESKSKRWKDAFESQDQLTDFYEACRIATLTWFSSEKAADVGASILASMISGVGVYALWEASGAAMQASGRKMVSFGNNLKPKMDILDRLVKEAIERRIESSVVMRGGVKVVTITLSAVKVVGLGSLRFFSRGGPVGYTVQALVHMSKTLGQEVFLGFASYWADENIVRPWITPYARGFAFEKSTESTLKDMNVSVDYLTSFGKDWKTSGIKKPCGILNDLSKREDCNKPTRLRSVEEFLSDIQWKAREWVNHIGVDVDEILENWNSATNYPEVILYQGKKYYDALLRFGGHEVLLPQPTHLGFLNRDSSDFHRSAFDKQIVLLLSSNLKRVIDLADSLFYLINNLDQLRTDEGVETLTREGWIPKSFADNLKAHRSEIDPKIDSAIETIMIAFLEIYGDETEPGTFSVEGAAAIMMNKQIPEDEKIEKAAMLLTSAVKRLSALLTDANSFFRLPAKYREGTRENLAWEQRRPRELTGMMDKYWVNDCGKGESQAHSVFRLPRPAGDNFLWRCDEFATDKEGNAFAIEAPIVPSSHGVSSASQRGVFAREVYTNRLYMALHDHIGYPFRLQLELDDMEAILYQETAGRIFAPASLPAVTERRKGFLNLFTDYAYGTSSTLFGNGGIRFYSNLDVLVEQSLCGEPLGDQKIENVDVPLISWVKKTREGLRVSTGLPSVTLGPLGTDLPEVCSRKKNAMNSVLYADYFSPDFMFLNQVDVAPLRHRLTPTLMNIRNYISDDNLKKLAQKDYADFLEFAMRRVNPNLIMAQDTMGFFDLAWNEAIAKPLDAHFQDKNLPTRYQEAIKNAVDSNAVVWKDAGVFSPGSGHAEKGIIDLLSHTSVRAIFYAGEASNRGYQETFSALEQRRNGLKSLLSKPLENLISEFGRSLSATNNGEALVYAQVLWKISESILNKQNASGLTDAARNLESSALHYLYRLSQYPKVGMAMIDRNSQKHPKNSEFSRQDLATAYGLVEAALPAVASTRIQAIARRAQSRLRRNLEKGVDSAQSQDFRFLAQKDPEPVDKILQDFSEGINVPEVGSAFGQTECSAQGSPIKVSSDYSSSTFTSLQNMLDLAGKENGYLKLGRNDEMFKAALSAYQFLIDRDAIDLANLIFAALKTNDKSGNPIFDRSSQISMKSAVVESLKLLVAVGKRPLDYSRWWDTLLRETGEDQLNCAFSETRKTLGLLASLFGSELEHLLKQNCDEVLWLDDFYGRRGDFSESIGCALEQNKISSQLRRDEVEQFRTNPGQ